MTDSSVSTLGGNVGSFSPESENTQPEAETPVVARDPSAFWCNQRDGEFYVSVRVEATLRKTVKADTKEEAREKIEAMFEAGSLDVDGSDIEDIHIDYVSAESPMYLVYRPGTTVNGTTRIQPGDEPREPKDDYERRTYTRPPKATTASSVGTTEGRAPSTPHETGGV